MPFSVRTSTKSSAGRLRISLFTLGLGALLMPALAHAQCSSSGNPTVTTCTSSAGITLSNGLNASAGSQNVVSGITGSVTNISLTFNNLDVNDLNSVAIVLVPPAGSGLTPLDLLSGLCGAFSEQIGNSTFTLADTASGGAGNTDGMLPGLGVSNCPNALSGTYLPTDWFPGQDTFNSPGPGTNYNSAGIGSTACANIGSNITCGSYNFSSFGETGSAFNGTWNLYIASQVTPLGSGSLGSWTLSFTGSSLIPTTTSIRANLDGLTSPVYTNSNVQGQSTTGTLVVFTATVTPDPGGGTVTFYDSTSTGIPGTGTVIAANVPVSNGSATTYYEFPGTAEGSRSISATYIPTAGYLGGSNAPNSNATVLTVNHAYNPSGATYCNGPVAVNTNSSSSGGTGGFPYPSQLILSGISGTIEDLTVTLNGMQVEEPDFLGFLLQAPNGNGYEFMSWADGSGPGGSPSALTNTTVWLADGGSDLLQLASLNQSSNTQQTCSSGAPCSPADAYVQFGPLYNDTFPSAGSPFSAPTSVGKAYPTGSATFTSEFGGAGANGTWLLYLNNWAGLDPSNNSSIPYGQVASWCLNFTMQANAHATTTAVSASPNPANITSGSTATVALTAQVTVTDGTPLSDDSNPGTVTFVDGSTTLGTANVSSGGVATLSAVSLAEGTHEIVASYSGTSSGTEFGISSGTLDLRVDTATTNPTSGSGAGPYTYCNSGSIVAPATNYDYGAALPYPSNIFVTGLPGTVNATTVALNNFTTRDQGDLMSLLVGPGGNNLDFFSLTGGNVGTAPAPFNLTFADGGSSIGGSLSSSGTFEPTSDNTSITYPQCPQNALLCGSADVGPPLASNPFTPVKAAPAGTSILGDANSAGVFGGTSASSYNGNGTWSLYIDDGGSLGEGELTNIGGWCVSFNVNLPTISFSGPNSTTLTQGGTGSLPAVLITNGGAGPIGDPTQTISNAMTVTDVLPIGLTFLNTASTDWNCAGTQTVVCTNEDSVSQGASYSPLTINVSVSGTVSGPIGNNAVSVSDNEAAASPAQQTASVTIDAPPSINSANNATFTVGSFGSFSVTAMPGAYPTPTFSEFGALPNGVTMSDTGVLSGTPASGTSGAYPIVITAANGAAPNATQSFTLTVDPPQFELTTAASPATGGTVTPTSGGFYVQGTSVPITASPNTGYYFVSWTSSPDAVGSATSANTSIPMNAAESVTANFGVNLVVTSAGDDNPANAGNCTAQATPGSNTTDLVPGCSLRDALAFAANTGAANITFASAPGQLFSSAQTITLLAGGAGTLTIPSNTTITGPTTGSGYGLTNLVTVNGGGAAVAAPVFTGAATGGGSSINNVIITNGVYYGYGAGGIFNSATSTLTVTNSTIAGNDAPSGCGGIYNDGATMTIINSTISGNSGIAGGLTSGPGGSLTVIGTTISGNSGNSEGGGLHVYNATAIITNSTISRNASDVAGGGIDNVGGTVTLTNTIVSGNNAPTNADIDGGFSSSGGNVIGSSNLILSSLGNNGGPTQTLVPLDQSAAICAGTLANATAAGITADQRGSSFDSDCAAGLIDAGSTQTGSVILSVNSVSFGGTTVDTWSASQWVSVSNKASTPVSLTGIALGGANASQYAIGNTCGPTLAAGANCFVHLHFQPTVIGAAAASVTITDSADTYPQTIALSGTGVAPTASLALSLSSLAFGSANVGTSTTEQTVTMTNTGVAAISITSIVVGGANASSFVFANSCGSSLAAGASCSVHGHFAPTTTGALMAAVTITDSDTSSPQTIALSGTGIEPVVLLTTNALAFGSVTENTPSGSQSVTLTNSGTAILSISSIAVTGSNASDFIFANNCGTSLAVGASCTIHGHFTPSTTSAETAAVTITDNALDSPESISLTGTGAAATDQVTLSSTNLLPGSTPTNLVFGSINEGVWSATQSVIMTNTGSTTLSIGSIVVGGLNANQFAFGNTCGATLAVGATCLIQGHFAPTTTGPMSASITITDSDTTSPQTIALSGTGVTPAITLSAASLSYAPTTVGTASGSQSVTVTNAGSATLSISSIAVTGANASSFVFANNCGASLGVGASCTVHGHFAPTATGPLYAAVTITYGAAGSPISIGLSGTGQ